MVDLASSGSFSVREYCENPDGRVLVLDYPTRQLGTVAPIFRFLIDRSIQLGMAEPFRDSYYLLDEIDHLPIPLKRVSELVNVGRGNSCQLLLSLQSVSQLRDTYNQDKANAILSGMITVVGLRVADEASVDYLRETIGTSFEKYTRNSGSDWTPGETEDKEEYQFAKGEFRRFDAGEAVICRQ